MKKFSFKKIAMMSLSVMMVVSVMSVNALAVYTVSYDDEGISLYVNYNGPDLSWNLSNGAYRDTMNGVTSKSGRGYSDAYYTTTSTKICILNVGSIDTNGTSGTVTFTVKDKSNGTTMTDATGKAMIYSFTTDSNGEMTGTSTATLRFSSVSSFYFEISTSNPVTTRCYGSYTITAS